MTDRERLIELLKQVNFDFSEECVACSEDGYKVMPMLEEFFADHLLSNGVIVPPCKVGDVIYITSCDSPTKIEETRVAQIKIKVKENGKISYRISAPCVYDDWGDGHWTFCAFEFGKTVFLTKEEAEKALKESEQ